MNLFKRGFCISLENNLFFEKVFFSLSSFNNSKIFFRAGEIGIVFKGITISYYTSILDIFMLRTFLILFYLKNFFFKFIYIVSAGLGFKKRKRKWRRGRRIWDLYIGNRHRLVYSLPKQSFIFIFKRSNIIFFSNSKNNLYRPLLSFRNARKELVFKIKGFYLVRYKIRRRLARVWAFARRIKFKKVKLKLSKKQKFV